MRALLVGTMTKMFSLYAVYGSRRVRRAPESAPGPVNLTATRNKKGNGATGEGEE